MKSLIAAIGIGLLTLSGCSVDSSPSEDLGDKEELDNITSSPASNHAIWSEPGAVLATVPPGWVAMEIAGVPRGAVIVPAVGGAACPSGFACVYQNANRTGASFGVPNGFGANLTGVSCSSCTNGTHGNDGTFNDQMTSWENESGREYCWWFNVNESGSVRTMSNGFIVNVLSS